MKSFKAATMAKRACIETITVFQWQHSLKLGKSSTSTSPLFHSNYICNIFVGVVFCRHTSDPKFIKAHSRKNVWTIREIWNEHYELVLLLYHTSVDVVFNELNRSHSRCSLLSMHHQNKTHSNAPVALDSKSTSCRLNKHIYYFQ